MQINIIIYVTIFTNTECIKKGNCTLYCSRVLNIQHIEKIISHYLNITVIVKFDETLGKNESEKIADQNRIFSLLGV